ncbi:MAG: radical SAM protein [Candidatus Verstraetearchaeota archaeon]|nr:radical SAM protein [Candidatus Verstraetearchaeota archaeon]
MTCRLIEQGFKPGSCLVYINGEWKPACSITLTYKNGIPYRLIHSYAHKSPEQYLSIYQSGCNWSCKKCHSWYFTKYAYGKWMSPTDIAKISYDYYMKNKENIYKESKSHITSWHAHELCRGCGLCILTGNRSKYCPNKLKLNQLTLLDDFSFGCARNIISFTGGDLACCPEFYIEAAKEIKNLNLDLWILFETNGYGLTPRTLDLFKDAGIDAFWLDIKAYDDKIHRALTGVSNEWILKLPEEITDRDFTLEVSTVYIPGWVEEDQISKIASLLAQIDPLIPYTIIAFIPEYKLSYIPPPTFYQMLKAFEVAKNAGLKNVRLGNIGIFIKSEEQYEELISIGAI